MADKLDSALDLMRRLPPTQIEDNLAGLLDLAPDLVEDLLSAVDQPLKIAFDSSAKRDYLLCDYNRDGDSYRSPWSNKYDPPLGDGVLPSASLRKFEVELNEVFDSYRDLYFEGGVSSVYCWDVDDGFAAVILIKKSQDLSKKGQPMKGSWDSIHVVEVKEKSKTNSHYKLTSTVMLSIETSTDTTGKVSLAGSMTRQVEKSSVVDVANPHYVNIGRMVEDLENKMREEIAALYFAKTKEVGTLLRSQMGTSEVDKRKAEANKINAALAAKKG
jgi:capping protein beta